MRASSSQVILLSAALCVLCSLSHAETLVSSDEQEVWTHSDNFFTLFTGGLPQVFWRSVPALLERKEVNISASCAQSLRQTLAGLKRGREWAFKFIDASSKTPPGFMDGSISGFGDFDQCLNLKTPSGDGNYCMLEFKMKNSLEHVLDKDSIGESLGNLFPLSGFFNPRIAICVPSKCSEDDILGVMGNSLESYPFSVGSTISCQTQTEIDTRASRLTVEQKLSICFLSVLAFITLTSSFLDWKDNGHSSGIFVRSFSMSKNARSLFTVDSSRSHTVDVLKLIFSFFFVSMHAVCGTDNPFGPVVIRRLTDALRDTHKMHFQIFFSDSLVEIMFLLGGFVTITTVYPMMHNPNFSAKWLLFEKWFRCVPVIMSLLALEFCWPLIGTGPYYEEASKFVLDNCSKNWWNNLFLVNNWTRSLEKCAPQLFYSAVDFQLFVVGLVAIMLLYRNRRAGLAFCVFMIVSNVLLTTYIAYYMQTLPSFVARGANVSKMLEFMDYIHLPTNTHAPAYFIGILVGYKSTTRTTIAISSGLRKGLTTLCAVSTLVAVIGPALYNTFQILPFALVPYYIVLQKLLYVMGILPILLKSKDEKSASVESEARNNNLSCAKSEKQFSFLKGICRLTFSIYLINYYCIRYDFLTSRVPFESGIYHAQKRFVFSIFVTFFASLVFHLFVVAPFESLRKSWLASRTKLKGA